MSPALEGRFLILGLPVKVKVAQLCPTLCNSTDYTVHGIVQARILQWVAIPFSRGSSQPRSSTLADSLPAEPQGKLPQIQNLEIRRYPESSRWVQHYRGAFVRARQE